MHHVLHSVFSGNTTAPGPARHGDSRRTTSGIAKARRATGEAHRRCARSIGWESAGGAQVEQRDDAAVHHLEEAQVAASTHRRKTRRKHEASERISNRFPHSPSPFPVMQDNSVQPNTTS